MDPLEQRRHARRRTMLDTGIALLGGGDGGAVGVRAVCRSTGITERYFYEAFGSRDDFIRAVYDDVSSRAQQVLSEAVRGSVNPLAVPAAAVTAFVELVIDRPDLGRVLLLAPYREAALSQYGLGHMLGFFEVVGSAMPVGVDSTARQLVSIAVVGAMTALFTEYLSDRLDAPRDQLVAFCQGYLADSLRVASPAGSVVTAPPIPQPSDHN